MTTKQITATAYVVRDHFGEYATDDDSRTPAYEEARRFASRAEATAHATRETDRVLGVYEFADPVGNVEDYPAATFEAACRKYFRDFQTTGTDADGCGGVPTPAGQVWGVVTFFATPTHDQEIEVIADGKGGVEDWRLL